MRIFFFFFKFKKSEMFNGSNPWGLINQDVRMAHLNTIKDRRNYYLMFKLLGMISVQLMGVGWCPHGVMNLSVLGRHCLQTLRSHIVQTLESSKSCIFLIWRKQLHFISGFSSILFFSHQCSSHVGVFCWSLWKSSPRRCLI